MIQLQLTDPAVQASLIGAIGSILAAAIAALCAALIGHQITRRKELLNYLAIATNDIAFLMKVEEAHCRQNVENGENNAKLSVRKLVREQGYEWSGKFVPSRVASRWKRLN